VKNDDAKGVAFSREHRSKSRRLGPTRMHVPAE